MSLDVKVTEHAGWKGSKLEDMRQVCLSVADCFAPALAERSIEPIEVVFDEFTPRARFDRVDGRIQIRLTASDRKWDRLAFQFSHELAHVISNFRAPVQDPTAWFEESFCEAGALFALRGMAATWQTAAPYPNWLGYSDALAAYASSVSTPEQQLPVGASFASWLREQLPVLAADCYRREATAIVAAQLLPVFEQQPDSWAAVRHMNLWAPVDSVPAVFVKWRSAVPLRLVAHVDLIWSVFADAFEA